MQLTHEHEEIKRTLKRFIAEEINPHVDAWEAAESFPAQEVFASTHIQSACSELVIHILPPLMT